MNILFISHRIPYPPNKGDKIRSFNEIKYLSRKHNIYLAFLVDDERDLGYLDELKRYCVSIDYDIIKPRWQKVKVFPYLFTNKPLSVPYFYSKKLQDAIDIKLREFQIDTIICFSSPMAEYIFKSKALDVQDVRNVKDVRVVSNKRSDRTSRSIEQFEQFSRVKQSNNSNELNIRGCPQLIMDFVDVDSDKWRIYAGFSAFPFSAIYRSEWKRLMNYEKRIGQIFDRSIFVSKKEVELFRSSCPDAHAVSVPNGVDFEFFSSVSQFSLFSPVNGQNGLLNGFDGLNGLNRQNELNGPNLLFMGAMDYFPNEDAVIYFSSEIWPYIKKELPQAKFYVVGANPSKRVRMLTKKDPHIVVTGYVTDVRPYLKDAEVFVAPLRVARGVQNKVLEAMAAGVPVVARPEAVQGLDGFNGCLKVEEDSERFALSIFKIISTPHKRHKMVNDSKRFILENHSWEENLKKLEEIIN